MWSPIMPSGPLKVFWRGSQSAWPATTRSRFLPSTILRAIALSKSVTRLNWPVLRLFRCTSCSIQSTRAMAAIRKSVITLRFKNNFDFVALLHGDGQYAPEVLPELLKPLDQGIADAVFGSRMLSRGAARKGGMPLYKLSATRSSRRFKTGCCGRI